MLKIFILFLLLFSNSAFSAPFYSLSGVISTSKDKKGVALFKSMTDLKSFASKEGDMIENKFLLSKIESKRVYLIEDNETYILEIGKDAVKQDSSLLSVVNLTSIKEYQREGNTIKVNRVFKDELLSSKNLSKILMQAAAIPYTEDGKVKGFQILEIDSGSIFDICGIQDGDIITQINDFSLNDAGAAIRMLNSLKNEKLITFAVLRNGQEEKMQIEVK